MAGGEPQLPSKLISRSLRLAGRSSRNLTFWIVPALCLIPAFAKSPSVIQPGFLHQKPETSPFSVDLPQNIVRRQHSSLGMGMMLSAKRDSPSAQRNKGVIWEVLSEKVIPSIAGARLDCEETKEHLRILEIAAGSGVHTEHFASCLSTKIDSMKIQDFAWFPTDPEKDARDSIKCYIDDSKLDSIGVQPPMALTLNEAGVIEAETSSTLFQSSKEKTGGSNASLDLIICINMIHISPWSATLGLMKVAKDHLASGGLLFCYGPYKEGGTAVESNLNFDRSLRSRDPRWGVRDLEQVQEVALENGLELAEKIPMPANNLSLIFRRRATN